MRITANLRELQKNLYLNQAKDFLEGFMKLKQSRQFEMSRKMRIFRGGKCLKPLAFGQLLHFL